MAVYSVCKLAVGMVGNWAALMGGLLVASRENMKADSMGF
jgi:hypothetical protein